MTNQHDLELFTRNEGLQKILKNVRRSEHRAIGKLRQTDRDRLRHTETERDRQRQRESDRVRQRQTETCRDRKRHTETEREPRTG